MRKTQLSVLVLAMCLAALPAFAGGSKGRTASGEYNTLTIEQDEGSVGSHGYITNGVIFKTRPGEKFVGIVIEDDSGYPARAVVGQDLDGDRVAEVTEEICGATEEPIKLRKRAVVMVYTQEGACDDGTMAVATFGTVTATFTR